MKTLTCVLGFLFFLFQTACDSSHVYPESTKTDELSKILREVQFIAYSPTHLDPNPEYQKTPTEESIREDLRVVRQYFDGLVTYGLNDGMEYVPAIAREMDYRAMILGIWDIQSEAEVNKAIQLTQQYPELIFCVCCGNEGLLNGRYDFETLETAMVRIQKALPSTYVVTSEPIHEYGYPDLRDLGDFVFPIVHPAFSGIDPSDPVAAARWVFGQAEALRSYTQGPILVKETGLPSGGRPEYSPQNQAVFWRTLLSEGKNEVNISYAAFESFDLPWKARDTGLEIEKHWGFWDANRRPKPVVEVLEPLKMSHY